MENLQEAARNGGFFHFEGCMISDAGGAPIKVSPRATAVAHAWLREPLYRELEAEASRRRRHVDEVAGQILTAAIVLGLVDTLISDAEKLLAR